MDSAGKHTPGPWLAKESSSSRKQLIVCPRGQIAEIGFVSIPVSEWEANARLIAAAPDLLAALERMLARFQVITPDGYSDPGGDISAARIAVARAKVPQPDLAPDEAWEALQDEYMRRAGMQP